MDTHRGDIGELRHEMQLGFTRIDARFQQVDTRFQQVDTRFQQVDTRFQQLIETFTSALQASEAKSDSHLEKELREQTRFFFVAWGVILASIIGLYAR